MCDGVPLPIEDADRFPTESPGHVDRNGAGSLHPRPPVQRYEHAAPSDLVRLDIKGMTRFGEVSLRGKHKHPDLLALHVAVDDHSRMAFTRLLPDQTAETSIGSLCQALETPEQPLDHLQAPSTCFLLD